MRISTDSNSYPLRPIGIGPILVIVGLSLLLADFFEFVLLKQHSVLPPNVLLHWFGEIFVLLIVFGVLYRPLKLRVRQRQKLINALQVSEAQYRTLVEGLDVGIALIDSRLRVVKANHAMSRFAGEPECFVSGRICYDLLDYADNIPCPSCPGMVTLETGRSASAEMIRPQTGDNPVQAVRVRTFPVRSLDGTVDQFIEVVEDISEEKQAADKIQRLSRELTSAAERERKRLARDLHDQCGQSLAGVQYSLEALRNEIAVDRPEISQHFEAISDMVEQIGHNIRQVSTQLHPTVLDDLGLVPTLDWLAEESRRRRPDIAISVTAENVPDDLPADLKTAVYRVCQESLNNAFKHAKATRIAIRLWAAAGELALQVEDNGCGFAVDARMKQGALNGHIGLHGMRERIQALSGKLTIDSTPGIGTVIEARMPYGGGG